MRAQLYQTHIGRLKRFFLYEKLKRILVIWLILFTTAMTIALVLKFWIPDAFPTTIWASGLLASLVVTAAIIFITKDSFKRELILLEQRLSLDEKLSTAHEYVESGKSSPFLEPLLEAAVEEIKQIDSRQIGNRKQSRQYVALGLTGFLIVLIVLGGLSFGPRSGSVFRPPEVITQEKRIEKQIKKSLVELNQAIPETDQRLREEINRLIAEIEERSESDEKLLESLDTALNKVRSERQRLSTRLAEQLSLGNTREIPELNRLSNETVNLIQLKESAERLREKFGEDPPPTLERDIDQLVNQRRFEDIVEKGIGDMRASTASRGAIFEDGDAGRGPDAANTTKQDPTGVTAGENDPRMNSQQSPMGTELNTEKKAMSQEGGRSREESADSDFERDLVSQPGSMPGSDESMAPYVPETEQGKRENVIGESASEGWYNVQVRSLTSIGETTEVEEEIIKKYQRDINTVFEKEEIPIYQREFIKEYFLSIGLQ